MEELKEFFINQAVIDRERAMFLHLYYWPNDGQITIKKAENKITKAYILIGEVAHLLNINENNGEFKISLTPYHMANHHSLIAFELEKPEKLIA